MAATTASSIKNRSRSAGIHLAASIAAAGLGAWLVFGFWYPAPYAQMLGGLELFRLIVTVDVVIGPILTFVVASPGKALKELRRDITLIVLVQVAAFAYGLHAMAAGRPVYLSFEIDRFRVVTAADVDPTLLHEAPVGLRRLSWSGPLPISAVKPTQQDELMRSIQLGLAGIDLSMDPRNWRDYDATRRAEAWGRARPASTLLTAYPQANAALQQTAASAGLTVDSLRFMPVLSRRASWVLLLAPPDSRIVAYLPFEGFF